MKLDTDLSVYVAKKMKNGLSEWRFKCCLILIHLHIFQLIFPIVQLLSNLVLVPSLHATFCHLTFAIKYSIKDVKDTAKQVTEHRGLTKIFQGIINIMLHYSSKI